MKKNVGKAVALGVVSASLAVMCAGCASSSTNTSTEPFTATDQGMYVSVDWLSEHMDDVVIVDARSTETFVDEHIPGAVNLHWSSISDSSVEQGQAGWAELLDADDIADFAATLGIDGTQPVIIYTEPTDGWGEDGRIYWSLREAGLEDVHILDGGYMSWVDASKDVSSVLSGQDEDPINQVDISYVKKNLDTAKLVDARSETEYNGEATMGEARLGHIPGAINIPDTSLLNDDGTIKSDSDLQKIFSDAGVATGDEIIVYCTGGVRAAFVAEQLSNQGYTNVSVYTAGYSEWAGDDSNTVEE